MPTPLPTLPAVYYGQVWGTYQGRRPGVVVPLKAKTSSPPAAGDLVRGQGVGGPPARLVVLGVGWRCPATPGGPHADPAPHPPRRVLRPGMGHLPGTPDRRRRHAESEHVVRDRRWGPSEVPGGGAGPHGRLE